MRLIRQLAVGSGLALVLAGCTQYDTAPTVALPGQYRLQMINGQPLPYRYTASDGTLVEVDDDVVTLNPDGTYADVSRLSTYRGPTTSTEYGTYSAINGSITFYDQTDNITYQGSLSGSVLTEIDSWETEVFQKL